MPMLQYYFPTLLEPRLAIVLARRPKHRVEKETNTAETHLLPDF
jgi:hypothetical protein